MENEEHLGNLLEGDGKLTTASETGLLEESIKRVVCIVDEKTAVFESQVVTEVMICASDPEPVLAKESNNEELLDNGPDVKVVDIENVVDEHKDAPAGNGKVIDIAVTFGAEKVVPTSDEKNDQSKIASKDAPMSSEGEEVKVPMTDGASDSDSEDDLQLIVNDEDIFYPHGIQGVEDADGEDLFRGASDEHYDERDWAAEMHYHHSQFKYVRPGSVPATVSPGIQDAAQRVPPKAAMPFTPGARGPMSAYMMGVSQWFQPSYEFVLPPSKTVFDIDLDQFEDKPWDYPGADITDYFNFGFTEESWKQYCEELARLGIEASMKSKMRVYENGHLHQACNLDSSMEFTDASMNTPEPQRILSGRGQGPRRMRRQLSGRAIQVEGGGIERRPSADMRRQRLRDSGSVIQIALQDGSFEKSQKHDNNDEFRRKQRGNDFSTPHAQRRKGFPRQIVHGEQAILPSPLAVGRLGRVPAGPSFVQTHGGGMFPGGMFGPPAGGRPLMYPARSRMPTPPIGLQGTPPNGFSHVGHSLESSDRPWRKFSAAAKRGISGEQPEDEEERGSYGSSERSRSRESDRERSEEEYNTTRNHYIENEITDRRSGRLAAKRSENFPTEKRSGNMKASGHVPDKGLGTEKRSGQLVKEKRPAQSITMERKLTEKRSAELPSENRQHIPEKRSGQPASEERSAQILRSGELVSERRSVFLSENKLVTEKTPAQLVTEKRSLQLLSEKRSESFSQEVKTSKTSFMKLDAQPKSKRQDNSEKDDLRMKVLERVSARWKLHLRMDDAHAKRKKANLNKAVHEKGKLCNREDGVDGANENSEGSFPEAACKKEDFPYKEEHIEDAETERPESARARRRKETREEKKQRHNERKERRRSRSEIDDKKNYEDLSNHDQAVEKVDERWQMEDAGDTWVEWEYDSRSEKGHRKRKRRKKARDGESDRYEGYLEGGEGTTGLTSSKHRSSSQHSKSRRRHKHYEGDDLGAYEDRSFRGNVEGESEEFVHREAYELDEDRWNEDEFAHEDHAHRSTKKRKYHKSNNQHRQGEGDLTNGYETDSYSQRYNHDETNAEYYSDQSMSSGQADEAYYKGRGDPQRCYSKSSYGDSVDRWTGSLYESDEDGYVRYDH